MIWWLLGIGYLAGGFGLLLFLGRVIHFGNPLPEWPIGLSGEPDGHLEAAEVGRVVPFHRVAR